MLIGHLLWTSISHSPVLKIQGSESREAMDRSTGGYFNTPDSIRRLIKNEAHFGWWVNICWWFIPFNSSPGLLSFPLFTHLVVNASFFFFAGLGPHALEEFWLFQSSSVFQGQLGNRAIIYSLLVSFRWRYKSNSYFLSAGQLNVMTL